MGGNRWLLYLLQLLKARGLIATGDLVVVVADVREEWADGLTDTIRSVQVGGCWVAGGDGQTALELGGVDKGVHARC